jgi:uncharacterized protein (DUF2147 family)
VTVPRLTASALAALLLCRACVAWAGPALADASSPVGLWRTFSDKDGRESGKVQIFLAPDGGIDGRIVGIVDPAKRAAVCIKCDGDRRDQPVMGMEILRGMQRDGDRWDGGQILDPENGETYRCTMRLEKGGAILVVRGFLGISLFGRSQRWQRLH